MLFEPALLIDDDVAEADKPLDDDVPSSNIDEAFEGIPFTIPEGFSIRDCFIQKHALYKLSGSLCPQDLQYVFNKNEHKIHQIARRLVSNFPRGCRVIITAADVRRFCGSGTSGCIV